MAERIVKQVRPRSKVPSLPKEIREKRVAAYARVSTDSDEQMGSVEAQKDYFEKLLQEMDVVAGLIQKCVNENAVQTINQDEYINRYNALVERHEKAQHRYDTLQKKRERRLIQADIMSGFLFAITELDTLQLQFNPALWHATVDHVTIFADERLVFHFMNGIDVEVRL